MNLSNLQLSALLVLDPLSDPSIFMDLSFRMAL